MFKGIFSFLSAAIIFGAVFFQPAPAPAQVCTPAPVGLTAWYPGDGNAFDARGGNDAALQGGAGFAAGKVGPAFNLNGTDAFVQAPTSPANDPTTAGSIEAWVYFNQRPSDAGHVMEVVGKGSTGQDFDLQAEPDNHFKFYVANGHNIASTTTIQINTWYYVAATWDAAGLKIYVNGNLENSISDPNITRVTNQLPLQIGNQPTFGPRLFNGLIDEPSIYNRGLSAAEVQSIFSSGTTGKCKPTAIFSPGSQILWLAGDGDARDLSGSANNGTLRNGAAFTVGKVGLSFSFDGLDDYVDTANFSAGSQATIETWINTNTLSGGFQDGSLPGVNRRTISGFASDCADFAVGLYNGKFGLLYKPNDGGCTALAPASAVNVQTNQWYHVAATIDGATAKIYVDGVLQATGATAANFVPTNKFRIGSAACCAGDNTSGRIDEFSIYSRALTAKEIQSIYNAGLAGKLKQATTLTNTAMVGDATVTFSSAANRTIQEIPLEKNLFPALPMGTNTGLIYDVSADVNDASPTVCFNLPIISPAQFSSLRVFHLENNQWQNRTAPSNTYPMLCTTGLTSLSPFAIGLNSPTAASVSIGGQVLTAKGSGIANARVSLTDSNGETRSALTNGFGFYRFEEVAVGETYTLNVSAKRYQFGQATQVISVYEDLSDNNFTAMP